MSYDTHGSLGSMSAAVDYAAKLEQNEKNYNSHNWIGAESGGSPCDPKDYVIYCRDCGIENLGDPAEFDIKYPNCADGAITPAKDFWQELYQS